MNKPIDNFNACDDFFMTVLTSHIIVAAMKYLHIESLSQIPPDDIVPDAQELWMQSKQERKDRIDSISVKIVEMFVDFQFSGPYQERSMDVNGTALKYMQGMC